MSAITKADRPGRRRLLRAALAMVAVDLLLVGFYLAWAVVSLPPPVPDRARPAGVVFFDAFGPVEGLGTTSLARVEHAAALFHAGKAGRLICVGGRRGGRDQPGAALMAAAIERRGVPAARVQHDAESFDTMGNWRSALALLPPAARTDPLLISSPLHLLRIRHITHGVGTPAPTASVAAEIQRRGALGIWLRVHREWVAWTAQALLPADLHRRWIRRWRDVWDASSPAHRADLAPSEGI
jgi:uncharacterized SAM-binding protein YcdF (DUF218 family)